MDVNCVDLHGDFWFVELHHDTSYSDLFTIFEVDDFWLRLPLPDVWLTCRRRKDKNLWMIIVFSPVKVQTE